MYWAMKAKSELGGTYVTHEGVDKYGDSSGRHEYNRRDIIKVDFEVIK